MQVSFVDDEAEYLRWLDEHPDGYVVNHHRNAGPAYLKLHRATCRSISTDKRTNYTTRAYAKTCSDTRADLDSWARSIGGELSECPGCKPG